MKIICLITHLYAPELNEAVLRNDVRVRVPGALTIRDPRNMIRQNVRSGIYAWVKKEYPEPFAWLNKTYGGYIEHRTVALKYKRNILRIDATERVRHLLTGDKTCLPKPTVTIKTKIIL